MTTSEVIQTRAMRFEFDPKGFVRVAILTGAEVTLADAQEALEATQRVAGGRRVPVVVDSRFIRSKSREARNHFGGEHAEKVTCAVALIVRSPVSRVIGNFFLRNHQLRMPTRLFEDEESAVAWVLQYIAPNEGARAQQA